MAAVTAVALEVLNRLHAVAALEVVVTLVLETVKILQHHLHVLIVVVAVVHHVLVNVVTAVQQIVQDYVPQHVLEVVKQNAIIIVLLPV